MYIAEKLYLVCQTKTWTEGWDCRACLLPEEAIVACSMSSMSKGFCVTCLQSCLVDYQTLSKQRGKEEKVKTKSVLGKARYTEEALLSSFLSPRLGSSTKS